MGPRVSSRARTLRLEREGNEKRARAHKAEKMFELKLEEGVFDRSSCFYQFHSFTLFLILDSLSLSHVFSSKRESLPPFRNGVLHHETHLATIPQSGREGRVKERER